MTFTAGVTSRPITVRVNGDRIAEGPESFFVRLTTPLNATIDDAEAVVSIVDNEP